MECNYCKKSLKTLSSLNYHKKNNKKCLGLQIDNINSILTICSFCNKKFTNIKTHSCKMKKLKESENNSEIIINELKSEITKLKSNNTKINDEKNELLNEICDMKKYIVKLEAENTIYSKDHETLTSIAKQPKTTSTTNNNYNLCIYDDNLIKDRFSIAINNIKPSDLYDGQKSIGRFVAPCLQNDDGSKMFSCTDYSRNVFVYKDTNGNINKDIKCKNLANLIEPIATAKVNELMKEDYDKRSKINRFKFLRKHIITRKQEIEKLENHLQGLKKETQQWYYIKSQILQKENDNERDNIELRNIDDDEDLKNDDEYCDEKLIVAADDIKEMKTDSSKFSKTISELV